VELYRDGEAALKAFRNSYFDLLILDVMMPKKDGFTVAREIREKNMHIPVIFLTAKGEKEDKIEGFESGADDYLTKPFSMEELLLRIRAVLRRTNYSVQLSVQEKIFNIGAFVFDYERQSLGHDDKEVHISTKEADLLEMLCRYRNTVLHRDEALKKIWGDDDYFAARSMDVYITRLRKYLKADPDVQIINVHGKGYKLMIN
jgi:DNA-binding response OmpR family regulator